jgi:hypothetical protein
MSFEIYKFLRAVRRARQPQIRVIPLAIRLLVFMAYLFIGLACVPFSAQFSLAVLSHLTNFRCARAF